MNRIILSGSSLELNDELEEKINIKLIPLSLYLGEKVYLDDGSLDIRNFVDEMHAYPKVPRTASPSPKAFYDAMQGYDEVFIVTLSSKLSTVYNSALLAKKMAEVENPDIKVHVFNSKAAISGETLLAIEIQELIDKDETFQNIIEKIENKIENMETYFILENLDNTIKNGRMSKVAGKIASMLSINVVCKGNNGEIEVVTKARGMRSGINKMVKDIVRKLEDRVVERTVICHVLKPDRAEEVKARLLETGRFKDIIIVPAKGVTSIYANEGGIVLSL